MKSHTLPTLFAVATATFFALTLAAPPVGAQATITVDSTAQEVTMANPNGVVNGNFQVHGTQNLRIVDASVFPKIPGFFIVTSIYMIGEKAADGSLQDA